MLQIHRTRKRMKTRKIMMLMLTGVILIAGLQGCSNPKTKGGEATGSSMEKVDGVSTGSISEKQKEENSLDAWEENLEVGNEQEVSAKAIRGVRLIKDGTPIFAVSYEPRTYKNSYDCWSLSIPYESWVSVDTEGMYLFFDAIENISMEPAGEVEDVDTGLDKSDTFFFVAYNSEQGGQEVGQAVPDKGIMYWIGNQNPDGRWYVKTSVDDQIFLASEEAVEKIYGVNPFDCILKVVNVVSVETVSRVEIVRGKDVYEMAVQDKTYKLGGKEVESSKFFDLYTAFISIYIEKEIPEDSSEVESRDPLLSITYHRNMKEAPQITCSFYDYDENYVSVNVNGTEFFLVNKSDLQKLDKIIDSAFA